MTHFEKILFKCKEFGFNEHTTREILWNEAYQLGRSRWWWGPPWMVRLVGKLNTIKAWFRLGK